MSLKQGIVLALLAAGAANAQSVTAIRAARMLDVKTGTVINNATIVVTGARITAAGANVTVPAGAKVIDLGDRLLMPGLTGNVWAGAGFRLATKN